MNKETIPRLMKKIGENAKASLALLGASNASQRKQALELGAKALREQKGAIIAANKKDLDAANEKGLTPAMIDRLRLDDGRIEAMAKGLEDIAVLPDPVGRVLAEWERPNGLKIKRVAVPLGVIGVIYESRPNVTADAGALCLKAGNACILRGGSDSVNSSGAIHDCLVKGLVAAGLPGDAIQRIPTTDRDAVGEMLNMADTIDVIVPRGGKSLIERITAESKVPLFKHLEGICHTYVDKSADAEKARAIVLNAKMRRTGICGATETLLVDSNGEGSVLQALVKDLLEAGCEVRGDEAVQKIDTRVITASEKDWGTEYLDAIINVRQVDGVDGAIKHIAKYGTNHTDAIISEDEKAIESFTNNVDSAIVMVNASTQFADGAQFGMGAEIGISTGKLHARGPVGVEQLTSFKYIVIGTGQTRPE
ncbi:MAG: glutamate-5-semialdehyde dehydrogenase [Rhodospirillaceae bacterium]|nr:glutamate-5-semialdehyde dehydrogenase [Rhodospirillaceae bacterium]